MNWVEIKVKTTTEAIEAVSNIFYEAGVAGVVIEDPKIYLRSQDSDRWDYLDIPEGLDFEVAQVTGYLVEDSSLAERTQVIRDRIRELPSYGLDIGKGEVALTTISEADWGSAWKKYYKPTHIGKNIVIKPFKSSSESSRASIELKRILSIPSIWDIFKITSSK
jgi:ribosomal protein L11 methyltransferase